MSESSLKPHVPAKELLASAGLAEKDVAARIVFTRTRPEFVNSGEAHFASIPGVNVTNRPSWLDPVVFGEGITKTEAADDMFGNIEEAHRRGVLRLNFNAAVPA
jgi:hypothetical protein